MMLRRPAAVIAATLVAATACSSPATEGSGSTERHERASHNHSTHEHGDGAGPATGPTAGGHASAAALRATLLRPADLPEGYISGSHHADTTSTQPGRTLPGCAPLASLLSVHQGGHGSHHPEAVASFSKSHFGPQITQKVIDHGSVSAARAALDDLQATGDDCRRYVHSTSSIGANVYDVQQGPEPHVRSAVSVRLAAVGDDFEGIHWDVWSTRIATRVVTIAFRSAPGGDNADLGKAVQAALAAQGVDR